MDLRMTRLLKSVSLISDISNRTFSRFRERNAAYELTTGKDLIHDCIVALSENIRKFR